MDSRTSRSTTFVVDGYNLMPALLSREERGGDLAGQRDRLESRLRQFLAVSGGGMRILLVYDGAGPGLPAGRREGSFEVHFSRPPRKADDLILELCRGLEGRGDLHVVTSDRRDIGERVGGLRLKCWTAQDYAAHVRARLEAVRRRPSDEGGELKPDGVSPAEAQSYLDAFGFGEGAARDKREGGERAGRKP